MTKKTTKQSPVFSAIEAHRRTLRQSRRASRACEVIKKKFPKLAPRDVPIWEKIPKVDDPRREAWERDQSIHKKARQMADVRRAEIVRYKAYMEASAKLRELCNNGRRSLALDWTLKMLRRIAEASEKKKPVQPRRKKVTHLRLVA
jgi:hypothetical protein